MSRIGSMMKQATQAAKQAERRVEQSAQRTVEQVKQRAPAPVASADSFEMAHGLYDAGAKHAGRQSWETGLTRSRSFTSVDSHGQPTGDRDFSGFESHGFAQVGRTVASAGGDAFLGVREVRVDVDADGAKHRSLAQLGVEAKGVVYAGTVNGFQAGARAGAVLREETERRHDLGGGRQLEHDSAVEGVYGAEAKLGAQVGTVIGAEVAAFVGVRGGGEERFAVTDADGKGASGAGRAGVLMGLGVMANLEAGYDVDKHQARVSAGAGAAVGVGAYAGGTATVGGSREG